MNQNCDSETGICQPSKLSSDSLIKKNINDIELVYVGDPMCSWCWGISPSLVEVRDRFEGLIPFKIIVGGLRPGGGDPWNDEFKSFLKHHWEDVNERSGQEFRYDIFERDSFNYDTEPACRAIVAARPFVKNKELEFFASVQENFYVNNQDPSDIIFYQKICDEFKVDFDAFKVRFNSTEIKKETHQEFQLNREWGVRGYPTLLIIKNNKVEVLANGFFQKDKIIQSIKNKLD